ncbi:hypothetical protein FPV67DRAFT_1460830 [Lyophyllum atratum]|nr:hypothetical protein FPV67DRAFT_1460830 [Lyophyllum atratum]
MVQQSADSDMKNAILWAGYRSREYLSLTMPYFTTQLLRLTHPVYGKISSGSIILVQLTCFTPKHRHGRPTSRHTGHCHPRDPSSRYSRVLCLRDSVVQGWHYHKMSGATVPDPRRLKDTPRSVLCGSKANRVPALRAGLKHKMAGITVPSQKAAEGGPPQVGSHEDGAGGVSHRELVRSISTPSAPVNTANPPHRGNVDFYEDARLVAALLTESEDSHVAQMALGDYAPITHVAQLSDRFYIDRYFQTLAPGVVQNLDPRDDPDDGNDHRPSAYADVCDYYRFRPPDVEASASTEWLY